MHDFTTPQEDGTYWCCYDGQEVSVTIPPCAPGIPGLLGDSKEEEAHHSESSISYVIYPNPVQDDFVLAFEQETITPMYIELVNMQGQKIKEAAVPEGIDRYRLSLQDQVPAVYFVKLLNESGQTIGYQKILKL